MKTVISSLLIISIVFLLSYSTAFAQEWNVTGGNTLTGGEYLGSDGSSTTGLVLKTSTNYPITFEINGANEKMRITTSGNVGIGTTTTSQLLHVQGNGYFSGNLGIATTTPAYKLDVTGDINIASTKFYRIGGSSVLFIDGNNNVAVGVQDDLSSLTGARNTFIGQNAGISNTSGYQNFFCWI
jgi:hypothetical protein